MNYGLLIGVALGYFPGLFILLRLLATAQKKMWVDRKAERAPKTKAAQQNLPKPVWPIWSERMSFTIKDTRPSKIGKAKKMVFIGLIVLGLIVSLVGALLELWTLVPIGYSLFFAAVIYSVTSAKSIIETRKTILRKMFEIGTSKGLVSNEYADNPSAVIKVLNWDDFIKPTKVEYQVRTEFSSSGEESFLQQFNQIFGTETAWVPSDDKETGAPGWNYDEGKVTLHAVPPLPQLAKWDETYVLDPGIAWSFFPIALGIENGIERQNPITGETEWILGFDLSGEAAKVGKKAGYKVSNTITTSPMVFIGGGTGGGKSLSADTPILVLKEAEEGADPKS